MSIFGTLAASVDAILSAYGTPMAIRRAQQEYNAQTRRAETVETIEFVAPCYLAPTREGDRTMTDSQTARFDREGYIGPVATSGSQFTPTVGDLIVDGGASWRIAAIVTVAQQGVTVAHRVGVNAA